ncbi:MULTISPECIES: DUF6630 family protein [Pseudomonas]|uniref:DUF6630 domain-containing protein n=1 Tax=Pseudomonas kulmbachensis TaxID=3043408 RepID=A0ABW7LZ63_9PSED|nr:MULTISPECIES: hypothetical protein [Pseudomonas]UXL39803.1 hypothetical protein N7D90_06495 [Pseudomonas fragi]
MGILDRLFGGRFTMPPPEETNLSASAIMKELRPERSDPSQKKALEAFSKTLVAVVPEKEGARLVRRVMRRYAMGDDASSALSEGFLNDSKGQKLENLVLLSMDWKGFDVFEYQAPYLVRASGLKEPYVYVQDGVSSMPEVLNDFDQWLARFGKRYLHLDFGDDNYEGVIVDTNRLEEIAELAGRAGIKVSFENF